jgi:hypothetical protein
MNLVLDFLSIKDTRVEGRITVDVAWKAECIDRF